MANYEPAQNDRQYLLRLRSNPPALVAHSLDLLSRLLLRRGRGQPEEIETRSRAGVQTSEQLFF